MFVDGNLDWKQLSEHSTERSKQFLEIVQQSHYDPYTYSAVNLQDPKTGHKAMVMISSDALKVSGVRINIDQYYGQQAVDVLGGVMLTRKVAFAAWQQAKFKPSPSTAAEMRFSLTFMKETKNLILHSEFCDRKLKDLGWTSESTELVSNVGKDWLLDDWFWLPGLNVQHCGSKSMGGRTLNKDTSINYGWWLSKDPKPIQGAANCHDYHHVDYSQVLRWMFGTMLVNDQPMQTADVLTSKEYCGLLLDGPNPLPGARHPSVPLPTT